MNKSTQKSSSRKKIILIVLVILLLVVVIPPAVILGGRALKAGNKDQYSVANTPALTDSALQDKTIIFLGSSVTYGSAAKGESFVDFMVKRDGIHAIKEAVSGTTLVDNGEDSYIRRMLKIDPNVSADAFICQLSTNDASDKLPLGEISGGKALSDFDTSTVAGAIEYIIAYAQQTWDCPVVFYTGTQYNNAEYEKMVDLLLDLQQKWDIGVIDLWNDPEMNAVSKADYNLYMSDSIHPTRAGYRDWWTPKFEGYLTLLLA